MTLHEQYDFLCEQASKANTDDEKRRLMLCAHTMFDFWQEATEGIKMEFDDEYKTPTVRGKKLVPFRLDNRTIVYTDPEARIKDIQKVYNKNQE